MILFDDIMLFLCLDAKETKIKGGETFYKEKLRKTVLPHPNSLRHLSKSHIFMCDRLRKCNPIICQ